MDTQALSVSTNDSNQRNSSTAVSAPGDMLAIYLIPVPWDWRLILQLVLAVIGVVGNSVVIHVHLQTRKIEKARTNNYKTYIAFLAFADLLTSICIIPYPLLSHVPDNILGHFYCKVVFTSNIMWISIVASVLTLTALTSERYIAIAYPMMYKDVFTVTTTKIIIAVIWIVSILFNTFMYFVTHLKHGQCIFDFGSQRTQTMIGLATFLLEYLIPVIIMLATNLRAIRLLQRQSKAFSDKQTSTHKLNLLRARKRVINMLLAVIIAFIICWSPDQVAFLAFNLGYVPFHFLGGHMYRAFVVLAFANSCFNPVLYALTNKDFREAFKRHLIPSILRLNSKSENTSDNSNIDSNLSVPNVSLKDISNSSQSPLDRKMYQENGENNI